MNDAMICVSSLIRLSVDHLKLRLSWSVDPETDVTERSHAHKMTQSSVPRSPKARELTPALLALLGFIAAVGPFATDMYLASFTDIATSLDTTASLVQLTLTAFMAGIATGQLVHGPLSDRMGRRPVLLLALGLFAMSSVAMVFAPTIEILIGLRVIQGFTGAAGIVVARAVAVDLSKGSTAVRALSLIATVVSVGPLIAPTVGGAAATVWGWRGVLAVLAVITIAMFVATLLGVPESLPADQRQRGGIGAMYRPMWDLIRTPVYAWHVASFGFAFVAIMSYVAASPFVGQRILGMSEIQYGLGFAGSAAALIIANTVNSRIAPRVGPERMLLMGNTLLLIATASMTALVVTGALSIPTFILSAFVLSGGAGLVMSNASALAFTATTGPTRGAGAALMGAVQFLLGGTATPLVGLAGEESAVPMVLCMISAAVISVVATFFGRLVISSGHADGDEPSVRS